MTALVMVASDSLTVARFSHGVAAAAAPRSTKAMLPIIVASSLERIAKIALRGLKLSHKLSLIHCYDLS